MKFEEAIAKLSEEAKKQVEECTSLDDMVKVFENNDLQITKLELEQFMNNTNRELTDDELDKVTGGTLITDVFQDLLKMFFKNIIK